MGLALASLGCIYFLENTGNMASGFYRRSDSFSSCIENCNMVLACRISILA